MVFGLPEGKAEWTKFLWNEGPALLFFVTWLCANIGLFFSTYSSYQTNEDYKCPHDIMGAGLSVARGAAMILNLNCALILLPVCRNLLSLVRGSIRLSFIRLLDHNITMHKLIAWTICLAAVVHTGAHFFNFLNLEKTGSLQCGGQPGTSAEDYAFATIAGSTGHIVVLVMFLMFTSSMSIIRRSYFEIFWYTHHLFVVFFVLLCIHGLGGLVKKRVVIDPTDPANDVYESQPPNFWKFVVGPFGVYLIERGLRFYRYTQNTIVQKVVQHPSKVVEIQLVRRGFHSKPGQYIFVHCPAVSWFEWHPFTLTSAPEEDFASVHIRVAGDWTTKFAEALGCNWSNKGDAGEIQASATLPRVAFDGPFGTASEDVFKYEVAVCVGTGIGVTPFASILKSIWYRLLNPSIQLKLRKVYFIWVCREKEAFEWFADLLEALEQQMEQQNLYDFLDARIYLTGELNSNEVRNVMLNDEEEADAITGLRAKTNFGRPQWGRIYEQLVQDHPSTNIGVFYCGPKVVAKELGRLSKQFTNPRPGGTIFNFNKENF
ncbi:Nox1 protein [Capsaspora owczarzaki ATCC 30864]|uniref:Nox1 protein n=1 Tax=Capsaspora owczarzaki (strain ATCC 30864) TaxID=595528 RepID=A0A0D2VX20_CAPO3|nr:Nox1 protein [Capsaspora owczarzaki ATCC 30864]KJE96132.1 Nox1 protein [Capsaspora owczarzaki ATCC 30864]|eukprot:XP_004345248.1 Nox1 protein [Capsaspora owczarzaki ATCC 30864]